jgi:hypothetical protein
MNEVRTMSFKKKFATLFTTVLAAAMMLFAAFGAPATVASAADVPANPVANVTEGPSITVNYTDGTTPVSVTIDLSSDIIPTSANAGYLFQRGNINNVVATTSYVRLYDVLAYAVAQGGGDIDSIWASGNYLTFTTDGGLPYTRYDAFTFENLMTSAIPRIDGGYFYGDLGWDDSPYGYTDSQTRYPTILALNTMSAEIAEGDDAQTTLAALLSNVNTSQAPRLLYGYPIAPDTGFDVGGNRFPSNIDSITIN